jgi:hypothetical protein
MAEQTIEKDLPIVDESGVRYIQDSYWRDLAECSISDAKDLSPDDFDGRQTSNELSPDEKRQVGELCGNCAVRSECLAQALQDKEKYGILGGLNARQRRPLMRMLNRQGYIDRATWKENVDKAALVRNQLLHPQREPAKEIQEKAEATIPKRPYRRMDEMQAKIASLIMSQPEAAYVSTETETAIERLTEDLGIATEYTRSLVRKFVAKGVLEKETAEGTRIMVLKLAS